MCSDFRDGEESLELREVLTLTDAISPEKTSKWGEKSQGSKKKKFNYYCDCERLYFSMEIIFLLLFSPAHLQ